MMGWSRTAAAKPPAWGRVPPGGFPGENRIVNAARPAGEGITRREIPPPQETLPLRRRHVRVDFPHRRDGKEPLPGELRLAHRFLAP